MKFLLIIISVLITYGSLFPFQFQFPQAFEFWEFLTAPLNPFSAGRGDMLGNVALFVPFGFAGVMALPPFARSRGLWTMVAPAGALFAFALQVVQLFIPSRDAYLVDVFWNVVGLGLGGTIALAPSSSRLHSYFGKPVALEVPIILAACWIGAQLMPFVPSLDLALLKDNLKPLLLMPEFQANETFLQLSAWLVALHFLSSSNLPGNYRKFVPALPFAVLAAEPFIVRNGLTVTEVIGALGGLLTWAATRKALRPATLVPILAIGILVGNLWALDFGFARNEFAWVPFSDTLRGSMAVNATALLEKLFLYGALIWLLKEAGLGWVKSTAATALGLLLVEALQVFVPDSSPASTDSVLAVLIGAAMYSVTKQSWLGFDSARVTKSSAPDAALRRKEHPQPRQVPPASGHLGALDGLRGLAALAVFGVHFNQTAHLQGTLGPFDIDRFLTNGNSGVALFFVLSGFLLSLPFWSADGTAGASVDVRAYAVRRFARILPAYYFLLALLILGRAFAGNLPSFNDILSHLLFLHNLKDSSILDLNPPFWTLAAEMQFYALLPFLFLALRGVSPGVAFAIVLALCFGSYVANYAAISSLIALNHWPLVVTLIWPFALQISGPDSFVLTYSTLAHLTYFFAGVAASWLFLRTGGTAPGCNSQTKDFLFWGSALAVFAILATPLDDALQFPFGHYNWPFVPFLLTVMVFCGPGAATAKAVLGWTPVRWLGLISYGVYIYHYPILRVTANAMSAAGMSAPQYWFLYGSLALAATIVMASLSYVLVERRVMQAARKSRPLQRIVRAEPEPKPHIQPPVQVLRPAPSAVPLAGARGWASISVGLRSEQVAYLKVLGDKRGRSLSGATRYVISDFIKRLPDRSGENGAQDEAFSMSACPGPLDRFQPGSEEHQHVVNLPDDQVAFLGALSARLGTTVSDTVRLIVDEFMKASLASGKVGS